MGNITDILSFSLNDGAGIRTTVFLKGCPLHCIWCHNPEALSVSPQTLYAQYQCVQCGLCASVCPHHARNADGSWATDGRACMGCGACAELCPTGASRLVGREMSAQDVAEQVLKDKPFFRERGGVTFSGGEPLLQTEFVVECLNILKKAGIHTAIETCLYAPPDCIKKLMPYVDVWLCDWKHTNPDTHKALTGQENGLIKENLRLLNRLGADIVLRCPIIPAINDTDEHFAGIAQLTKECPRISEVDLMPYHDIGNDKRRKMGLCDDGFTMPDAQMKTAWLSKLQAICKVPVKM